MIGLHPLNSQMYVEVWKTWEGQAAMHAEPFHQQWFVLITGIHEKHKALKMLQSNTTICKSLLETATEN